MSLARQHRDRFANATPATAASVPASEGGLATIKAELAEALSPPRHSLALQRREQVAAMQAGDLNDTAAPADTAESRAAHQVALRLTHDLRRLKDIKGTEAKIAAKREMLLEYAGWIEGALEAGGDVPRVPVAAEVLPTIMVWAIDIGDFAYALRLAEHVIRYSVPLPGRYKRDAPTLVLEEIAEVALKAQAAGEAFPLDVLEEVEALVDGIDMHDQPRAKLLKAIGAELARRADQDTPAQDIVLAALDRLRRAQALDSRIGVKGRIRDLEKTLAALPAPETPTDTDQAGTPPAA